MGRDDELVGRRVQIRPMDVSDLDWLYGISSAPGVGERWRLGGASLSPDAFTQFVQDSWVNFIIERRSPIERIGMAQVFGADPVNGIAHVSLIFAPEAQRLGWPLEGLLLAVRYAFAEGGFRKLYFEVPGFNLDAVGAGAGRLTVEEARLKDHVYYDGEYHDLHVFALSAVRWEAESDRLDRMLRRR